jgi:SAM-dependent methyltransferase
MAHSSWHPAWEQIFSSRSWGKYPPEELVAFVSHQFGNVADRGSVKLLELGCGPGANVWFMSREGYCVSGVDGSPTAIDQAQKRLAAEGLTADLRVADFVLLPFQNATFHGVIDVASIMHNRVSARKRIMNEVRRVLRPGGRFFSLSLGRGSWGDGSGDSLEPGTYDDIREGPAKGVGTLHFLGESEIPDVCRGFASFTYERKELTYRQMQQKMVYWILSAVSQ